jgi:hypothetical protein
MCVFICACFCVFVFGVILCVFLCLCRAFVFIFWCFYVFVILCFCMYFCDSYVLVFVFLCLCVCECVWRKGPVSEWVPTRVSPKGEWPVTGPLFSLKTKPQFKHEKSWKEKSGNGSRWDPKSRFTVLSRTNNNLTHRSGILKETINSVQHSFFEGNASRRHLLRKRLWIIWIEVHIFLVGKIMPV